MSEISRGGDGMNDQFRVTKETCAARITGICPRCGGGLEPIETVDNSGNPTHWSGCNACMIFTAGVKPVIYKTALLLVDEGYKPYSFIIDHENDSAEKKVYNRQTQVSGACDTVRDVLRIYKQVLYNASGDGGM